MTGVAPVLNRFPLIPPESLLFYPGPAPCLLSLSRFSASECRQSFNCSVSSPLKQSREFTGGISMSQFIPASPNHSLCNALGKITFMEMKRSSLCLQCLKAFCEVKPSMVWKTQGENWGTWSFHFCRAYFTRKRHTTALPACPKGNGYQIEAITYTKKFLWFLLLKKFEKCPSWMLQEAWLRQLFRGPQ